jgi:16S rRNA (adenine1518-N6/adenine1519-N6)-dimethyltransferase
LIDPHVLNKIVAATAITGDDVIVEVGPGIGGLTEALAEKAKKVIAVEIDQRLLPVLADTLNRFDNIRVINGDILKIDLNALAAEEAAGQKIKLAANLPYYITTPIIMNILENYLPVSTITVMVQKEVGERMRAQPGTKDYGALTLAVHYYADCYLAANVPQNCFMPRPAVDSAVIRLTVLDKPRVAVKDEQLLFRLIKAGFYQRRKTLLNCLTNYPALSLNKTQAQTLIAQCALPPDIRGEKLDLNAYAALADALYALR